MKDLQTQVAAVRRRLNIASFFQKLPWCWTAALVVAVLALIAGKFLDGVDPTVWNIAWLTAGVVGGLLAAGIWAYVTRVTDLQAALALDHEFELAERVSSSLALDQRDVDTPAGQALVDDAVARIQRVELGGAFRYRPARTALLPLLPALVAVAVIFVVLPTDQPAAVATPAAVAKQVQQAAKPLRKQLATMQKRAEEKNLQDAKGLFKKLEQQTAKLQQSQPKDRKEALAKLNDIGKQMQERRNELAAKGSLKDQLAAMKEMKSGPGEKLSQALKQGNMKQAAEELRKLQEKLADSKMSKEEKAELGKQLEDIKKSLEEIEKKQEQAEKNLKEQIAQAEAAGQSAQAAKLQQKLEKLQKERSSSGSSELAKKLQEAAEAAKTGNANAASKMKELADKLEEMNAGEEELAMIDEAMQMMPGAKLAMACDECEGDGCEACGEGEESKLVMKPYQKEGSGGGQGGQKPGDKPATELMATPEIDADFKSEQLKGRPTAGRAFGGGTATGPNAPGQVEQAIKAEVEAAKKSEEDPVSGQKLSKPQREFAKEYFDAIREGN